MMAGKKNDQKTTPDNLPALRIGSRVRCTEDGIEGHISWANGVSVKIKWNDGEQVTWRRDSLAKRPIEILDPADDEGQATANTEMASDEQNMATALPGEEPLSVAESVFPVPEPAEEQAAPTTPDAMAEASVPSKRRRKTSATPQEKKLSALDAAAKILAEAGQPLSCQEMITMMAAKGYWISPGGKTPHATLYSAIFREITVKGTTSRFVKAERGKFALANKQ